MVLRLNLSQNMNLANTKIYCGSNPRLSHAIKNRLEELGFSTSFVAPLYNNVYFIDDNNVVWGAGPMTQERFKRHSHKEICPAHLLLGDFSVRVPDKALAYDMMVEMGFRCAIKLTRGLTGEEYAREFPGNKVLVCTEGVFDFVDLSANPIDYKEFVEIYELIKETGSPIDNLPNSFVLNGTMQEKLAVIQILEREGMECCRRFKEAIKEWHFMFEKGYKPEINGVAASSKDDVPEITFSEFMDYFSGNKPAPKSLPKINGYTGRYNADENLVVYGCAEIDADLIKGIFKVSQSNTKGNRRIENIVLNSWVIISMGELEEIVRAI